MKERSFYGALQGWVRGGRGGGAVPLLGDLFDLGWKANRRNLRLLEQYLERPATTKRTSLGVVAAVVALFLLLLCGAAWLVAALVRLILT